MAQEPGGSLPQVAPSPTGHDLVVARAKESFSSLSLKGSDLHAEPPLPGGKGVNDKFIRELWQLRWRPSDPIDLYVILPRGVVKPPVVLYLYGFPSKTDRFKNDRYCERVVRNGAAAVGFVSALTGYRTEHRPPKQWFVSELQESLATSVHDVQMILNYLDSRGDLDMTRVGMFGQGSGGAIAILAAAADSRLKVLDLLDPWGDWPHWLAKTEIVPEQERPEYLRPDFLKRLEPLEPVSCLTQLRTRRIRIQFVGDSGESKEAVRKLEAAAPSTTSVVRYQSSVAFRSAVGDGGLFQWIATALQRHLETKTASKNLTSKTNPAN